MLIEQGKFSISILDSLQCVNLQCYIHNCTKWLRHWSDGDKMLSVKWLFTDVCCSRFGSIQFGLVWFGCVALPRTQPIQIPCNVQFRKSNTCMLSLMLMFMFMLRRIINWYNDGLVTLCHQSLCIVICSKAPFRNGWCMRCIKYWLSSDKQVEHCSYSYQNTIKRYGQKPSFHHPLVVGNWVSKWAKHTVIDIHSISLALVWDTIKIFTA